MRPESTCNITSINYAICWIARRWKAAVIPTWLRSGDSGKEVPSPDCLSSGLPDSSTWIPKAHKAWTVTYRQKHPSIYPQPWGQGGWSRAEQLGGAKDRGWAPGTGVSNGNGKQGNPWMKNLTPQVASAGHKILMYFQADWGHYQKRRQLRYGVNVWKDDGSATGYCFFSYTYSHLGDHFCKQTQLWGG